MLNFTLQLIYKINSFNLIILIYLITHRVDFYAKQIIKKIKRITPDIKINLCYRSRKIHQLYSYTYEPNSRDIFSCTNCVYKFHCFCSAAYIGHCKRMLKVCAKEHKQPSKSLGVLELIVFSKISPNCPYIPQIVLIFYKLS